jgi:site-specific recombinase XerD
MKNLFLPLFDNIDYIHKNSVNVCLPNEEFRVEFNYSLHFLKSYNGSLGTFNSYRREIERLLQWSWNIKKSLIKHLTKEDIETYIKFCQSPPAQLIGIKKVPRYLESEGIRVPNQEWHPYVITLPKAARKNGVTLEKMGFSLSQGAIQEIFAILSTYFNFLIAEEYLLSNPVALIRQKSKFIRKKQHAAPIRRLSLLQWDAVLRSAEKLAAQEPEKHERTLFILRILYGMYLRISELAASDRWTPTMNDFAKDSRGAWWFTTVGKGNKERQIAVSENMLKSLTRWRMFLGLTPLPNAADNSPLIPKIRGNGPMSDTAPLRRIVQKTFDYAEELLRSENHIEEADSIRAATVHWLRHTGISEDVKIRPREHVRDDAGHSSSATTDRYIDVELYARYQSAKKKNIDPNFTQEVGVSEE